MAPGRSKSSRALLTIFLELRLTSKCNKFHVFNQALEGWGVVAVPVLSPAIAQAFAEACRAQASDGDRDGGGGGGGEEGGDGEEEEGCGGVGGGLEAPHPGSEEAWARGRGIAHPPLAVFSGMHPPASCRLFVYP